MSFFFDAAEAITKHLKTRNENWVLRAALDRRALLGRDKIERVWSEVVRLDYDGFPRYVMSVSLPGFRKGNVALELAEEWLYPSMDLLRWKDRVYPYDRREAPKEIRDPANGTTPSNPWNWQGRLVVRLRAEHQNFYAILHFNALPWNRPRDMAKFLGDYAKHLKLSRRRVEQDFLQEIKEIHPGTGQRVWYCFVDADIRVENLHTLLVLPALRQKFPVPDEDANRAMRYVLQIVQRSKGFRGREDAEDFSAECFSILLERFDAISFPEALPKYVSTTATGLLADERRKRTIHEAALAIGPYYTVPEALARIRAEMASDDMPWVPNHRTLYDWTEAKTKTKRVDAVRGENGNILITEEGLEQALVITRDRNMRQSFQELAKQRGLSSARVDKIIQRNQKPDGTLDCEAIYGKIKAASPERTRTQNKKKNKTR